MCYGKNTSYNNSESYIIINLFSFKVIKLFLLVDSYTLETITYDLLKKYYVVLKIVNVLPGDTYYRI